MLYTAVDYDLKKYWSPEAELEDESGSLSHSVEEGTTRN